MQVSLKNCSEYLCIIDPVSVNNFYNRRYITREIYTVLETVYHEDSNTASCKFIFSLLGSLQCCVDMIEQQLQLLFHKQQLTRYFSAVNVVTPVKSQCKLIARSDKDRGQYYNSNIVYFMYQSVLSLNIPPDDPWGFAHSRCPWSRVFAPQS